MSSEEAKAARRARLVADPAQRASRAHEKRRVVLRFLRDEVWSVAGVMADLLGISYAAAHATLAAMERDGLILSSPLVIQYHGRLRKSVLYGITAQGLAFAFDLDEEQTQRNPWEVGKTNPIYVPHQIEIQSVRIKAELAGWTGWKPARQMQGLGLPNIPDAVAVSPEGAAVAVEVELHIKTPKRYEAVTGAALSQIKAGRWSRVDYLCPDADFAARLARVFSQLKIVRLEQKGQAGKVGRMLQQHLEKFRFYALDQWPGGEYIQARQATEGGEKE